MPDCILSLIFSVSLTTRILRDVGLFLNTDEVPILYYMCACFFSCSLQCFLPPTPTLHFWRGVVVFGGVQTTRPEPVGVGSPPSLWLKFSNSVGCAKLNISCQNKLGAHILAASIANQEGNRWTFT